MTANIARDWRNDPLDRNIVPLVNALTELGFETRSSCHGHCRNFALPPYVTFESAVVDAASISRILRDDAESGRPRLYWGWRVDAGFDDAHRLYFRITTDNPRRRWYRWSRRWIDKDLRQIPELLLRTLKQVAAA
jgi:hypothetical protein